MDTQKNLKTLFENTIINNIDFEGYDISDNINLYDKVQTVYNIFKDEYVHKNNENINELKLFKEWLQGLPSVLTVPFYNYDIIENAKKYGYKFDCIESENNFLNHYWYKLSEAFFTLKENL